MHHRACTIARAPPRPHQTSPKTSCMAKLRQHRPTRRPRGTHRWTRPRLTRVKERLANQTPVTVNADANSCAAKNNKPNKSANAKNKRALRKRVHQHRTQIQPDALAHKSRAADSFSDSVKSEASPANHAQCSTAEMQSSSSEETSLSSYVAPSGHSADECLLAASLPEKFEPHSWGYSNVDGWKGSGCVLLFAIFPKETRQWRTSNSKCRF